MLLQSFHLTCHVVHKVAPHGSSLGLHSLANMPKPAAPHLISYLVDGSLSPRRCHSPTFFLTDAHNRTAFLPRSPSQAHAMTHLASPRSSLVQATASSDGPYVVLHHSRNAIFGGGCSQNRTISGCWLELGCSFLWLSCCNALAQGFQQMPLRTNK